MDYGVFIYIRVDMEFTLLFLFTLVSTCNGLTGDNVCKGEQNESGEEIKYCCNDFQEKNNMCVECDPGFLGDNCNQTCPGGYYGKKCAIKCNCTKAQICHHVCGCLQMSNTMDNITTNNTEVGSSYSAETCFSSNDISTDSTGATHNFIQSTRLKQGSPNQGYFSKLYFFVTLSGSALVLLVVMGLLSCFCSRKNRSASDNHHIPVYGEEERNRSMDNHTGPGDSGEELYGTCDRDCYSTLALRVNLESVRPLNETSDVTYVEDNLYASVVKSKLEDGN